LRRLRVTGSGKKPAEIVFHPTLTFITRTSAAGCATGIAQPTFGWAKSAELALRSCGDDNWARSRRAGSAGDRHLDRPRDLVHDAA
jgi:hypothetical protein